MMFTNVFRIGGLQTVSWFQLVLDESSRKAPDSEERELLTAHIQLQNDGRLTSWTFSSQDKGQRIKLWLFFPGRFDNNRPNINSGLKVLKSGLWICPGNSTEVTAALCQALRNRFERALSAFAYVRFGSMFVKCKRYASEDTDFRKTLPSCEATFLASDEGIFVHLRVRRRRMRPLAATDVRAVLTHHSSSSTSVIENPAVVVAPYGLTGWLTGCFPGDLVRQLSQSKSEALKECSIRNSFPQATVRNSSFMSRSWYVEVRMKFLLSTSSSRAPKNSSAAAPKSQCKPDWIEKAFIFPSEAVLVPTVPPISARTYLKRCWLRKLAGTDWLEDALSLRGFSPLTSSPGYRLQAMGKSNTIWKLNSNSSKSSTSSGSGGSSIKSSDSRDSSGSESDVNDDGEYREDADSAATMAAQHGTRISSSEPDSKRLLGNKRGRDQSKNSRRTSPEMASSAPTKPAQEQAGTPWEWNEQSDADFFAEFGDFGDFFEGDGLVFGEPPGTAESQAYMFPFDGDGSNTPGSQFLDTSDPMRLPILDFPMLEALGQGEEEPDPGIVVDAKSEMESSPSAPASLSLVAKSEAFIFSTEYAPVDMNLGRESFDREHSYRPDASVSAKLPVYTYGPTPPPTPAPRPESYELKLDSRWGNEAEDGKRKRERADPPANSVYNDVNSPENRAKKRAITEASIEEEAFAAILATDLDCAMFQVQLYSLKGLAYCAHPDEPRKVFESSMKECVSEITDSSDAGDSLLKSQKKVPERIAGDADEISHDGPRPGEVGVWRSVGLPKQQHQQHQQQKAPEMMNLVAPAAAASPDPGSSGEFSDGNMVEILDAIPLLVQQAACSNDISLNGDHGDGPMAWLSLHQKISHETGVGSMSDLRDPSVTEVSPATVASVLQSDMRQAMGVAFSDLHVSGPLNMLEWCRGRAKYESSEMYSGMSDSKELVSSITGEPITPPQSTKVVTLQDLDNHLPDFRRSSREAEDKRVNVDDGETQTPSYAMLPVPTILVGYQEDWLKTSPKSLRYWEKAPFEPYGYPKPVTYYVVCLALDSLLCSALEFFQQLSSVYEACKFGTHVPANVTAQTISKRSLPGFVTVELNSKLKTSSSSWNTANNYVRAMSSGWDAAEFRRSLRRVCKSLPVSSSSNLEADHENSPCTVVYVVSPTSEPSVVLQTLMESCQGLGPNLSVRKNSGKSPGDEGRQKIQPVTGFSIGRFALQIVTPETLIRLNSSPAGGLEVLKELSFGVYNKLRRIPHKTTTSFEDAQQQLGVYSKSRIGVQGSTSSLSGIWKDCNNRGSGLSVLGRDSLLDPRWSSPSSRLLESTSLAGTLSSTMSSSSTSSSQPLRLIYEPLLILADGCLLDHSMGQLSKGSSRSILEETSMQSAFAMSESSGVESEASQPLSFHCCYSWSRSWQWLISVWTDSRGKILDVKLLPAPRCGSSSEKEACSRELYQLFSQVMQQGQQLLSSLARVTGKVQNVIVTRIGEFYDTEYQEWQRFMMNSSDEPRNWSVVIRPEGAEAPPQQRSAMPGFVGLPGSPGSSSFASRGLLSGFSKSDGIFNTGKPSQGLQWVQNVTFATVTCEESLQILNLAEASGAGNWSAPSSAGLATGFGLAKTIASLNGAYLFVPAHGLRYLLSSDSQPLSSKADIPAFGQWIQSRGVLSPVSSGYVISGPTTPLRAEAAQVSTEEEWPCTLHVGLVAHFGSSSKLAPGRLGGNGLCDSGKVGGSREQQVAEARCIVERLGADFYSLSWLTISPMHLNRRLALPFHCDVADRIDKLVSYVESELSGQQHQSQQQTQQQQQQQR